MKPTLSSKTATANAQDIPVDPTSLAHLADLAVTHPALADPEWRHLLDEIAHPDTTHAFHRLAMTAA